MEHGDQCPGWLGPRFGRHPASTGLMLNLPQLDLVVPVNFRQPPPGGSLLCHNAKHSETFLFNLHFLSTVYIHLEKWG